MHSKDYLAQELEKVGLTELAEKARAGTYHDFLSPLDMPELELQKDLLAAITLCCEQTAQPNDDECTMNRVREIIALRKRHIDGEFDATAEESEAWAKSPEGQAALRRLMNP